MENNSYTLTDDEAAYLNELMAPAQEQVRIALNMLCKSRNLSGSYSLDLQNKQLLKGSK